MPAKHQEIDNEKKTLKQIIKVLKIYIT